MVRHEMWEGAAANIKQRCCEMDAYILRIKLKAETYEDFKKGVDRVMFVSFEDTFKKSYWDKDFTNEFIIAYSRYFRSKKDFLNQLRVFIGLKITDKKVERLVPKWRY